VVKAQLPSPRGRPRSEESRSAVLAAANQLLRDVGLRKMTIEAVAVISGVGKPTIYRWWETKGLLALDAYLDDMVAKATPPDTGNGHEDFRRHIKAVLQFYSGPEGRVFAEFIAEAQGDPLLAEAFRSRFLAERRRLVTAMWKRGVERGEFRDDVDVDVAMDMLFAPIIYRLLAGHAPLSPSLAKKIQDAAFTGLITRSASRNSKRDSRRSSDKVKKL
jgi:AcrR family transcriptional regulator